MILSYCQYAYFCPVSPQWASFTVFCFLQTVLKLYMMIWDLSSQPGEHDQADG